MLSAFRIAPDDSDFREWDKHFGPLIKQDDGTFKVPTDELTAEWINKREWDPYIHINSHYDGIALDAANFFNVPIIGNEPYPNLPRIYDISPEGSYAKLMWVDLTNSSTSALGPVRFRETVSYPLY